MKYLFLMVFGALAVAVMTMSTPAVAAEKKAETKAMAMTMEGYVVDTKCAEANKDKMDEFVKTHGKECATAPGCKASGYNLYSEGKLYKFDKKSNAKVSKFLEKADSKLHVKAEVEHGKGNMIKLMKIENAE